MPRLLQRDQRTTRDIPLEIYASLVDSLYSEGGTLLIGSFAVSAATIISWWKTGEFLLLLCGVAIALVAALRVWDIRNYGRTRHKMKTSEVFRHWEVRYVVGASASVALLGAWCFISIVKVFDPFVTAFSLAVTIAYMIGITGRNFGSARLVLVQILAAVVPITAALLFVGDIYYSIMAVILIAFFMSMKSISDRLRRTLLDAVIANREMGLLANRFDTALNNMPHGLVMFDAKRRLVVTNQQLMSQLGLPPGDRKGASPQELIRECVDRGTVLRTDVDALIDDFERLLSAEKRESFIIQTQGGRTLNLTFEPMEKGGSVVLFEDITERRASEARINHLARYDSLTGLPNRMFLREQMEGLLSEAASDPCAVMFVDLDYFKQVNDTLGHPRGDILLKTVADRLRRLLRSTDIVARFGGDEFVVVQPAIASTEEAAALAKRIVDALAETYEVDGHQVVIGASVGIAISPRDATGADHLLKIADMALYWAKADQRGTWRFFEPEMDTRAQARRSLELDLRKALSEGSFRVYYQPLFDLRTKRVSTCEALLRWPHPSRGMISPAEFIPVAEEMGLIVELGDWVLHQACQVCATWPAEVRVAVNLSANQFRRGDIAQTVENALEASGLAAHRLELEITESVLLQDTRATRQILRVLRELGVRISLDDFGTGYSSLSYLHGLPLNKVKIDRSFLEGLETGDRSLVLLRGIAKLSADLGLDVTVEGIETAEQLALISAEPSVTEAQGFLFSPALPAPQVKALLDTEPQRFEKVA